MRSRRFFLFIPQSCSVNNFTTIILLFDERVSLRDFGGVKEGDAICESSRCYVKAFPGIKKS